MKTILQYNFQNYTLAQFDETMFFFQIDGKKVHSKMVTCYGSLPLVHCNT